jgi:hypothetical protein
MFGGVYLTDITHCPKVLNEDDSKADLKLAMKEVSDKNSEHRSLSLSIQQDFLPHSATRVSSASIREDFD